MVKLTQEDGSVYEYRVIDDPDKPRTQIHHVQNMKDPLMDAKVDDEEVEQEYIFNKAKTDLRMIRQNFGNEVASLLEGEFNE